MAKTIEEIKVLLETELFKEGLEKKYISLNEDQSRITYNCKNTPSSRKLANPEESVQATAYLKLILEYNYAPENIDVNKAVQIGSGNKEADIIVYNDKNHKAIIVVECKEEDINERQFRVAVDQATSYAHALACKYVWVTSGIKYEAFEILEVAPLKEHPIADIPVRSGEVLTYKYKKGSVDPKRTTQQELIQKFKSAHNSLWGGGALAPTTAFDELDKLIFCKVWDERWETNDIKSRGYPYKFQIIHVKPKGNTEEDRKKAHQETLESLKTRIFDLYAMGRIKDPEVFKDDIKLSADKIYTVVEYLQDINLLETDLDAKGVAFQSFMSDFFRGDFGQYFTPNNIVKFIVDSIEIDNEDRVLDTSCGSGGFLLHALKKVRDQADHLHPDKGINWFKYWHDFAEHKLCGIEINEQISRVAKMNMIIHDDGHTNVITSDGLVPSESINNKAFENGTFDLIITNPPFGSTIKASESKYYKSYELFEKNLGYQELKPRYKDNDDKRKFRPSQSTEVLFFEQCYNYLDDGGFMAVVIPDGILTNSSTQYVRDWITDHFRVVCIASLPQTTFAHVNAGVKSSVMFLKKHDTNLTQKLEKEFLELKESIVNNKLISKDEKSDLLLEEYKKYYTKLTTDYEVLMLEIENIGYDATGREINGSELKEASEKIKSFIKQYSLQSK